ncbi:MAG: putative stress-responsive transcriptional regulator [Candidatus Berkelbacteria bacterium Licking1014_2]|uniref:Putative stress-responsive transcriptional regulator n=1 Tax=Candidatus Berkelbacteria bacterium Licking1014_2 TaxID=2017146 RepID=A0A554LTT0_9BACT|nr:MAG: putative stress-responsive transcriptional regulator [Candidatus Berkelbacteria bacterium Licking1014_2]
MNWRRKNFGLPRGRGGRGVWGEFRRARAFRRSAAKEDKMEKSKQLYRSRTNRVVAGVCGGLGKFLDIDPVIIRILFVILTLWGGAGILLYIICVVLIPLESNGKEDNGTKSDLGDKIESAVKEIKDSAKEKRNHLKSQQIVGLILIALGIIFIVENFWPWFEVGLYWPIIPIAIGLAIIAKTLGRKAEQ